MAIAMNKKEQAAPQTITFTAEELKNFLASFKEQIKDEIKEEVKRELFAPLRDSLYKAYNQANEQAQTLAQLKKQVDEIYAPIKRQRRAEAEARLAARNYADEEEEV